MKKYNNLIIYLICLSITFIIFIPFLMGHYAGDTYNIEAIGYQNYALNYNLKDGRPFIALFNLIIGKLNIPIKFYVFLTLFLALIISNFSVISLKKIIERYKNSNNIKQKIIVTLISYVFIFNFMYMDCLNFAESCFIALSIFLFIKSADILCENQKKSFIESTILAIMAILCYQSSISIFFASLFLFTVLRNKNDIKQEFKNLLKGVIITIIALGINFIAIKLAGFIFNLNQDRVKISISIILRNIKLTFVNMFNILYSTCDMFPKGLFLVYLIFIIVVGIIYAIKYKKEDAFLYKLFIIALISILSSFVLNIISTSSFYGGRTRLSIGATIGILLVFLYIEGNVFDKKNFFSIILSVILISYTVVTIYNYEYLMISQKKLNILENKEMIDIADYIEKYEKDNNIKVNNITKVLFLNQQSKQYYKELPQTPFTSSIIRSSEFADRAIKYYIKENMESTMINSNSIKVHEYVTLKDNDKGYKCIGNTLYLSVYSY